MGFDRNDDLRYDNLRWKEIQMFDMPSNLNEKQILRWNANIKLIQDRIDNNIIQSLECTSCAQQKPYYSFNIDIKGGNKYGRYAQCRDCVRVKRYKSPDNKTKKVKNANTFINTFTNSIRRDISSRNKTYYTISGKELWNSIEKNMGYSKIDLIKHIESQFLDWMNWQNNGHPKDLKDLVWHLDHIEPKSKFNYTSIEDADFIKCWSLSNLKPIEAKMNVFKSDRDFMKYCASSFRKGLIDLNANNFIWKKLPYSPLEARDELEKKYADKIDWDQFSNSNLHIDHVMPQAYLSFSSFEDENFLKCWDINNLQIMINKDNCTKGSLFEGKIWFYRKD